MTPKITRRDFLKVSATTGVVAAVLAGCESPRRWVTIEPYVRPPEEQLTGQATWYASTCRQCPAGCGIVVRIMNGRALKIEGNPEHPINQGKLCPRGQAGLQILYNPDRLGGPMHQPERGSAQYQPLTWDDALHTVGSKLAAAGSHVAVWGSASMSGHLLDLFNRFTTAVGGSAPLVYDAYSAFHGYNILRSTSTNLFGVDALPAYDLSNADVVYSFGADIFATGLSSTRYGLEYGRMRSQPLGKRGYLVQFEPRMSNTGAKADRWLPVRPGSEGLIAQALLRLMADQRLGPPERSSRAQALAGSVKVGDVATATGIPAEEFTRLARIYATTDRSLAIPGETLAGHDNATSAVAAVQALNLVTARIGQTGGLLLSPDPALPGIAAVTPATYAEARNLIAQMQAGNIQALMIYGANPAYELPEAAGFVKAVSRVPFVVSFAPIADETATWADYVLPDHSYLESWGYQVAAPNFGTPVISSQQPVVTPYFDSRSTADVLLTIAKAIPAAAKVLPWDDEVAFLRQVVSQLPPGTTGGTSADAQWAHFLQHGGWRPASKPNAVPSSTTTPSALQVSPASFQGDTKEFPYYLHLFTSPLLGTGSGASQPWLQGSPDPLTTIAWQTWVELNPATAAILGVVNGDVVKVTSPNGEIEAPVYVYPAIRPDTVAIPLGQGHSAFGRYAQNRGANAMRLMGGQTDATGTTLAWGSLRVKITPTGTKVALATFENTVGVTQGFLNQAFPGQ